MMAAPLILGNDIRDMSDATKAILMNKDVIAVDQDPLGIQGWRFYSTDGIEYWFKPLIDGEWALCVFNRTTSTRKVNVVWSDLVTYDNISRRSFKPTREKYKVKNLWTGKYVGFTDNDRVETIPGHDVVLYRLTPVDGDVTAN